MTSGLPVGKVGGGGGKQSVYKHLKISKLDLLSLLLGCSIGKLVNPRTFDTTRYTWSVELIRGCVNYIRVVRKRYDHRAILLFYKLTDQKREK